MKIILKQNHHTVADFTAIFSDLKADMATPLAQGQKEVWIYPELYLTGYPLQDLVLQREFVEKYLEYLADLDQFLKNHKDLSKNRRFFVGGLTYEFDDEGLPLYIRNVIFDCEPGVGITPIYTKCLLPNYDIFDEQKYFTAGDSAKTVEVFGQNVGLLICEDMWFSSTHKIDPVQKLYELVLEDKAELDYIINLSASPFFLGKQEKRIKRATEIAELFDCPFAYVNRVGGEDEILFDGQSFVVDRDGVQVAQSFNADTLTYDYKEIPNKLASQKVAESRFHNRENSWESQFKADFQPSNPIRLRSWSDENCEEVIKSLGFGLQEYATKCGFNSFTIALSGGMDSGLVLTLAKLALREGQKLEAIYMPSRFSADLSTTLSEELCKQLDVPLTIFPISPLHNDVRDQFDQNYKQSLEGLADENIQSRLRGTLLYTRSNQAGSMVINTSNKSELAVGYSTQYGDSVGAISLLGDLYKSEVYNLAEYIHKTRGLIPRGFMDRAPSAELRENQEDQQSLPPYEILDAILEGFLSYRHSVKELIDMGLPEADVKKVYGLYTKSEYKRNQFCPIIKVKAKSFGFGYRVPITKKVITNSPS